MNSMFSKIRSRSGWTWGSIVLLIAASLAVFGGRQGNPVQQEPGPTAGEPASSTPPITSSNSVGSGPIVFTEMQDESGVNFIHVSGDSSEKPFPAANGSGVAIWDFDLDGQLDLLFLTGNHFPLNSPPSRKSNRAFRQTGSWQFKDATNTARLGHAGYSAGVAVGDFNADGFPDAYLSCYGANQLFQNQGDGTFVEVGNASGVDDPGWGTSAAFFDYDTDGLLDLYVCNYAKWTPEANPYCGDRDRNIRIFCNPTTVEPDRHRLFHNDGAGQFHDTFDEVGLSGVSSGRGQGIVATDLNEDGLIDVYVGNDLHPNFLFLNLGGGRFEDASESSGTAHDHLGRNQAGMGVDASDVNRDGRFELFVTNYEGEHNAFYENMGHALFQDLSHSRGLAAESIPHIGWGTVFADFDLDGWPDVVVSNGHTDNNLKQLGREGDYEQPAGLWHNVVGHFSSCGGPTAGSYFSRRHVGRGLAVGDLDNDGDADLVFAHKDGAPALLRNDTARWRNSPISTTPAPNPKSTSLRVQLIGVLSNRDAIGARVLFRQGNTSIVQQIQGGRSYLSAHDLRLLFAWNNEHEVATLEIDWPSGTRQQIRVTHDTRTLRIVEPSNSNSVR